MTYEQAHAFIFGRIGAGIKVGLRNSLRLAAAMDTPHTAFSTIHVAGTSGKGSTVTMLESILRAAGYATGLYTSPHLHDVRERIRINGAPVPERYVTDFCRRFKTDVTDIGATYFETLTALAYHSFARARIDVALVETGLGGTHDATNIITPAASLLTPVSYDHTGYLGSTLGAIAGEKAGIIKPGVPAVSAVQRPTVLRILKQRARAVGAPFSCAADTVRLDAIRSTVGRTAFTADTHTWGRLRCALPLSGEHQAFNARLALAALESVYERFPVTNSQVRDGLRNSVIHGRIERIGRSPDVIVDMAHNPEKIQALCRFIRAAYPERPLCIVFGAMKDKDIPGMLRTVRDTAPRLLITCRPHTDNDRAADAYAIAADARKLGIKTKPLPAVREAVAYARDTADKRSVILVTGSIHTVAEATRPLE